MEATKTMYMREGRYERRNYSNRLFTGRHLCTAILVAAGLMLVAPIRISDEPQIQDPSGDPIEAAVIAERERSAAVFLTATDYVTITDQAVPLSSPDEILAAGEPEPVLPDEAEPVLSGVLGESLDVPPDEKANNGFKSYMDYRTITSPSSKQYEMQQEAWTDELGLRRYGDYYMVALGTFYAQGCGETFRITLDSGFSFDVITGDIKDDKHTDEKHQHRNGVIVEFIVDSKAISSTCRVMGDMSHAGFSGRIESIQRLGNDM